MGNVVLPILFILMLFLLPWLDWRKERRPFSRPVVIGAGVGFLIVVFTLLTVSLRDIAALPKMDSAVHRGHLLYQELGCVGCHRIHGEGEAFGPDLSYVGDTRDRDWLMRHFREPQAVVPGSTMPAYGLDEEELKDLTNYMLALKQ